MVSTDGTGGMYAAAAAPAATATADGSATLSAATPSTSAPARAAAGTAAAAAVVVELPRVRVCVRSHRPFLILVHAAAARWKLRGERGPSRVGPGPLVTSPGILQSDFELEAQLQGRTCPMGVHWQRRGNEFPALSACPPYFPPNAMSCMHAHWVVDAANGVCSAARHQYSPPTHPPLAAPPMTMQRATAGRRRTAPCGEASAAQSDTPWTPLHSLFDAVARRAGRLARMHASSQLHHTRGCSTADPRLKSHLLLQASVTS
eukprot:366297-Chlamydomonas_euryale.AAC.5